MSKLDYLDFNLLIEGEEAEGYQARVLESPAGQAVGDFTPPFSGLELENFFLRVGRPRQGVRRLDSPEMEAAKAYGARLFSSLFTGEVYDCFLRALATAQTQGKGLRLRLRVGAPELNSLPWEFLHNPHVNRFLSLSLETPIVRYLEVPQATAVLQVNPPLNMLIMVSSPSDYPPLKVEEEFARLQAALQPLEQRGLVAVDRLDEATLEALQKRLRTRTYHILHFIGHGGFDPATQDGVLLFEDANQRGRPLSGQYLGTLLHDHRSMRLVVLNACEGARTSAEDAFSGVAQGLVQQGLPAVIAMQFEITDQAALTFAQEFYTALADGYPVDGAVAEARKSIFAQGNDIEWGTPVFFTRAPDGVIFDIQADATHPDEVRVPAALVIQEGPRQGEALKLFAGPNIIGREAGNRIVLDDEMVSRRHASLYLASGAYYIKDLNSTHGTWLNNQRVRDEQMLKDGDLIRLGNTTLRLQIGAEQPAPAARPAAAPISAGHTAPALVPQSAAAPPARLAPALQPAARPVSAPASAATAARPASKPASPSIFSRRLMGIPVWLMGMGLLPVLAVCIIGAFVIVPRLLPATVTPEATVSANATDTPSPAQVPTNTPEPFLPVNTPTPASPSNLWTPIIFEEQVEGGFVVPMVFVPAGEFWMGNYSSVPVEICAQYTVGIECSPARYLDEEPPHRVVLDEFLIDQYEVSILQYYWGASAGACAEPLILGTNEIPDYFFNPDNEYENYPVTGVTWDQAASYCLWRGARLPTEAEWEKAARGTDGRQFPWGDYYDPLLVNACDDGCGSIWSMLNYDDGYDGAAPVDAFPEGQSIYGAYNMAGNAAELVADFYDASYYTTLIDGVWNPFGPYGGELHVVRGGSWSYATDMLRTGARFYVDLYNAFPDMGFRCARNP